MFRKLSAFEHFGYEKLNYMIDTDRFNGWYFFDHDYVVLLKENDWTIAQSFDSYYGFKEEEIDAYFESIELGKLLDSARITKRKGARL